MAETSQQLISMIQKRHANRLTTLNSLVTVPMDNIPEEIQKMREHESAIIRAVMQEQSDLMEIINMLYPPVQLLLNPPPPEKKSNPPKKHHVKK